MTVSVSHVLQSRFDACLQRVVLPLNSIKAGAVVGWCCRQRVAEHLVDVLSQLGDEARENDWALAFAVLSFTTTFPFRAFLMKFCNST